MSLDVEIWGNTIMSAFKVSWSLEFYKSSVPAYIYDYILITFLTGNLGSLFMWKYD